MLSAFRRSDRYFSVLIIGYTRNAQEKDREAPTSATTYWTRALRKARISRRSILRRRQSSEPQSFVQPHWRRWDVNSLRLISAKIL